jgi:hypothetical protein
MTNGNRSTNPLGLTGSSLLFTLAFVIAIAVIAGAAFHFGIKPSDIALLGFIAFSVIILAFAAAVLWQIGTGAIQLVGLISEPPDPNDPKKLGKASLSRFQFLIFTFVIAGLFLMLCIETGAFVDIPTNVLALLGISGGSYVVSKAVEQGGKKKEPTPDGDAENGDGT